MKKNIVTEETIKIRVKDILNASETYYEAHRRSVNKIKMHPNSIASSGGDAFLAELSKHGIEIVPTI